MLSTGVFGSIIVEISTSARPEPEPTALNHLVRDRVIAKAVPKVLLAWNRDALRRSLVDSSLRREYVKLIINSRK